MVEDFYLYILMRNDMDSLNPGKAVAQGSHATSVFHESVHAHNKEFKKWKANRKYGTVATLEGSESQIDEALSISNNDGYESSWVIDETYPLKDGKSMHYFPCKTCAYVFAPKGYMRAISNMTRMK